MKKLSLKRLTEEDIATLGLSDVNPGWFVHDPNNLDEYVWVGEYKNQEEAREARDGLKRFYQALDNPNQDDMLDEEHEDDRD